AREFPPALADRAVELFGVTGLPRRLLVSGPGEAARQGDHEDRLGRVVPELRERRADARGRGGESSGPRESRLISGMDRSTQRVEALTDGVFAIATTLLVLNLAVQGGLHHHEFLIALRALGPKMLAYVVSFLVIAVYWIGHHNQFFWIRHV